MNSQLRTRFFVAFIFLNSLFASSSLQAQASEGRDILLPILMELALLPEVPEFIRTVFDGFPESENQSLNDFLDEVSDDEESEIWVNFFPSFFFKKNAKKRIHKMRSEPNLDSGDSSGRDSPLVRTRSDRKIKRLKISKELEEKIKVFKKNLREKKSRVLKVLIADDIGLNLRVLKIKLQHIEEILGIEIKVVSVNNGQDAYNLLEEAYNSGQPFDFALLDINMPNGNGDIAAENWRIFENKFNLPKIPIFAISTMDSAEHCKSKGMDMLLAKEVNELVLLSHMLDYLTKKDVPIKSEKMQTLHNF